MKYAILTVLCLVGTVFGAYSYDAPSQTLSLDQADLVKVIDPGGPGLSTVQQSFGVDVNTFRALPGLDVIDFGNPSAAGVGNPTSLQVNGLVKFNFSTEFNGSTDTGYWWGGRYSYGRTAFSGPNAWSDISTVQTFPAGENGVASWFDVPSITGSNVTAVGFCLCAHNSGPYYLSGGVVKYLLDDGTNATVAYPTLGTASSPLLNQVFFGYQAPAGRHIVGFYGLDEGPGTNYIAIDDLSFTVQQAAIQPHPGDANDDGSVDVVDLGILAKNYGSTGLTPTGYPGSWQKGDFNADGNVDVIDLGILAKNYGWTGAPAGAVPEPATLAMLAIGGVAALIRRRK